MTLGQLRGVPGAGAGIPGGSAAEDAWAGARAAEPGWITGPEADAPGSRGTVAPAAAGHADWAAPGLATESLPAATGSPLARAAGGPPGGGGAGGAGRRGG